MMPAWLEYHVFGNTVADWLVAAGSVLLSIGVVTVLRSSLLRRLEAASARTETFVDDYIVVLLQSLRPTLVVLSAMAWALLSLELPAGSVLVCRWVLLLSIVMQAFRWVNITVAFWVANYEKSHGAAVDRAAVTIITFTVRITFWVIIGLETLRYFHKSPTTLLAGLGVSGIALALGVQSILSDLLAALAIMLDKPFVVGDTIAADTFEGVVEKIGLKSVRLRAATGEQLIFGNADLMRGRIRNLTRRSSRRLTIPLSVGLDTPAATLLRIPEILAEQVAKAPHATLERAHLIAVTTAGFEFEVVLRIDTALVDAAFDARQMILLGALAQFERERISLAQGAVTPGTFSQSAGAHGAGAHGAGAHGAGATAVPRVDTESR
jgi:small-conductance mechanosensitive channel